jgi:peptide/nickel transport system substrate-binding protein
MRRLTITIVSLLLVATFLLSACGGAEPTAVPATQAPEPTEVPATKAPEPTAVPTPKQLVIAIMIDIVDMDPNRAFSDTYLIAGKVMYETLTELDLDNPGNLLPGLATSWEINEDSTVYTFHLQEGVKFATGREMTAKDVKWSWERLGNLQGQPAWLMDGVETIEAVDDYTVRVTLAASDASFLAKTSVAYTGPMDSEVAEQNGCVAGPDAATTDTCKEWLDEHSVGVGPYVLDRWIRDSEIRLVPNPYYWKGTPVFDSVVFKHVPDATAQAQLLQQGDADFAMNLDPDTAKQLEGKPGVILDKGLSMSMLYLAFNTRPEVSELTSNQAFRQAVLHAIDFEGLHAAVGGGADTAPGIISYGLLGAGEAEPYEYDVDMAKELLAEAGYPDGASLDMHYGNITQFSVDFNVVAQKLQADLAQIGITLNLFPEEFSVWIEAYRAGENPITVGYNTPDYADPHAVTQLFCMVEGVFAKRMAYSNPVVEDLVMQAVQSADPAERTSLYGELQQLYNEDAVFHPLLQPMEVIGYRDSIQGFRKNPINKVNVFDIDKQ